MAIEPKQRTRNIFIKNALLRTLPRRLRCIRLSASLIHNPKEDRSMRAPVRAALFTLFAALAVTGEAHSQCPPNETFIPGLTLPFDIAEWPSTGRIYAADLNQITRFNQQTWAFEATTTSTTPGAAGGVPVFAGGYWGNPSVTRLVFWPTINGMVAAGNFTSIDGNAAGHLAFLGNGATSWQALGVGGASMPIGDISVDNANNLVVVGLFTTIGGVSASRVARSDGVTWQAIGAGPSSTGDIACVHATAPNDIVIGGMDSVASAGFIEVWNGSTWTVIASTNNTNGLILSVLRSRNGDIYATGFFSTIGGVACNNIAKWNGTTWVDIGGVGNYAWNIEELTSGDIIVAGVDTAGGVSCNGIARYNAGAPTPSWDSFSPLTSVQSPSSVPVFAAKSTGTLNLQKVYITVPGGLYQLMPACYPATAIIGDTCPFTTIPPPPALRTVLGAQLPWAGTTFTNYYFQPSWAAGTNAILALDVATVTPYPLSILTPADPSCILYLDPTTSIQVFLGPNSFYKLDLPIPSTLSLVGSKIYEQVVAYSATGNSFSTNAFEITIGGF